MGRCRDRVLPDGDLLAGGNLDAAAPSPCSRAGPKIAAW